MADYKPTIGLEVHAELKTKTKLFCNSKNDPDETRPNVNICPVCMGYPGTLPVINHEAIRHMIRIGLAIGGEIADATYFDRKNYFYPDIPKGFQISQYKHPIVSGGEIAGVAVTRVHLEEDTARSQHAGNMSLIDFNRAGLPLMELVTEPVVKSAEQAGHFARELQLLLRTLSAGDANMEKGEMRVEANVSVSKDERKGTKVEVKNLNSFRAVERAIAFEIERQIKLLEQGTRVVQETRGWDESKQVTFSQRAKEEAHDYRYFPEPDLTTFRLHEIFDLDRMQKDLPELPWEKRKRYQESYGLSEEAASVFVRSGEKGKLFAEAISGVKDTAIVQTIANFIASEIPALVDDIEEGISHIQAHTLRTVAEMKQSSEISSRGVKEILSTLLREGGDPKEIAERKGLKQQSDEGELIKLVEQIIEEHDSVVKEYQSGKESALQFLVGQGMKMSKGSANPEVLKKILIEKIK